MSVKVIRLPSAGPGITGEMAQNSWERSGTRRERKSSIDNPAGAEKEKVIVAITHGHVECRKNQKCGKRTNENRTDHGKYLCQRNVSRK
jgi:hypothetical protein